MGASGEVLPANTGEWDHSPKVARAGNVPALLRTPKGQLLGIFLLLLVVAAPAAGGWGVLPHVASAVVAACAVELLYQFWDSRRWAAPTSALLSGLIVAFILAPQEPWPASAWVGGFAIVGKHVVQTRREHVFNPAALALLAGALLFGSGESWWGALADLPWPWIALLLAAGLFVAGRLNKLPLVLAFTGAYFGLFTAAAFVDPARVAEMFRAPFVQSVLFLAFFMLTDPPTSPNRLSDQLWYGLVAAAAAWAAQLLGAGQIFLLVAVLVANAWLAMRRRWLRRPAPTPRPERRTRRMAVAARGTAAGAARTPSRS